VDSSLGRLQLAVELILMIFEELDDASDVVMLGLTHNTLMIIGWNRIQALLAQGLAPWVGDRIICIGDHGDDLPEGMISDEEYEKLYKSAYSEEMEPGGYIDFYEISGEIFKYEGTTFNIDKRFWKLSKEECLVLDHIMEEKKAHHWEKGWVLMNLSKKEYVSSQAASGILPSLEAIDARCFGQLLLSRICWSTSDDCGLWFEGPIHRGVWAGDRFKIVRVDVFERNASCGGWKDVSVEAAKWLRDILWCEQMNNDSGEEQDSGDEEQDSGDEEQDSGDEEDASE
jgi:hypothetical protein